MSSSTTSGAQFAEVTVDIETGIVKVTRVLVLQDCGLVVSRLTAESQCYGGVIGSLNFALFEDRILDRNTGQMVNPNMEWYLLAGMSDIPQIDVRLKDQPERGVIGLGEPPTVSTAAAIALAVRNATGVTMRSLPLTPAKILGAMRQSESVSRGEESGGFVKAFAYVNPTNEKDAVAALSPQLEQAMPIGGGQDLLARMKDYVTQPDRIVNVKSALESTVTPFEWRAADRRGDEDGRSCGARGSAADVSGDRRGGDRSRHAADPESGNGGRQSQSAAALLVLPQRGVRLLQEGRQQLLLARGREPVSRDPRRRTELHRASVEPGGSDGGLRRDVPPRGPERRAAGAGGRLLHAAEAEPANGERACAGRTADPRDPARARQREERALRSPLQGIARLADRLRHRAAFVRMAPPCNRPAW